MSPVHTAQPTLRRAGPTGRGRKPRRVGHNLLLRLSVRKPDVLRFLSDLTVPFTNNIAERDGRMMACLKDLIEPMTPATWAPSPGQG